MNLLERIKDQTKKDHQQVEKVLIGELKNLSYMDAYAALLERLYAFFKPLETRVHQVINSSILPDIDQRQHSKHLLHDILSIRGSKENTKMTMPLSIDSVSYALGVLYVMEGSTLGGQIIVKMLDDQLAVSKHNAHTYFNSYGTETHTMWVNFKEAVLAHKTQIDENLMITGAQDTFNALRAHLLATTSSLENTI